jgi:hypothetical protein
VQAASAQSNATTNAISNVSIRARRRNAFGFVGFIFISNAGQIQLDVSRLRRPRTIQRPSDRSSRRAR